MIPRVALATTVVLWASAFVGIRHLGDTVPPGSLSLGRLVVMVAALGVYLALKGGFRLPTRREWPLIALGGASWLGIYNLALNESERRIDAATAALIVQVGPIVVALLAGLVLKEVINKWVLIGTGVGFAGVVVIGRASANGDTGDWIGVALSVVAALTFAVGVLTQKKLLPTMNALLLTFWYAAVGLVVCLPWSGELVSPPRINKPGDAATFTVIATDGFNQLRSRGYVERAAESAGRTLRTEPDQSATET